jgi:hypothetical protein
VDALGRLAQGKRVALAQYHGQDPTGVPPELKSAGIIERGEYLARAADCAICHTAKDGVPFAGGRAFVLPFGTLYSTNITPDPETGIGNYTDVNFLKAVHEGIARGDEVVPGDAVCKLHVYVGRGCTRDQGVLVLLKTAALPSTSQYTDLSVQPAQLDGLLVDAFQS